MFRDAGPGFRVDCDYEAKCIRVEEDVTSSLTARKYFPTWREVAQFHTIEEWERSKYASRVTDPNMDDAIAWFWIDLQSDKEK